MMYNSMLSPKLLEGEGGKLTASAVAAAINPDDIHFPRTKLVVLENTMNKGGGSTYDLEEVGQIRKVCADNHLKLHLDGARIFNAIVKNDEQETSYGQLFDSISVCFSKGLGAPVGSVLLGGKELITHARRVRKVLGGAMRQAGYLAAACSYALDNHVKRLKEDHDQAKAIAKVLSGLPVVKRIYPAETNIVIAELTSEYDEKQMLSKMEAHGILAVGFGKGLVRFVTHLDFSTSDLDAFEQQLKKISW